MSDGPKGFYPVNQDELNKVDSNFFFLKEGVTQLRVLPPYSNRGSWFREIKEHDSKMNGEYATATCPRMQGKACIFCDEGQRLYNLGDEKHIEQAKTFRPKQKYLFNVMIHSSPQNVDLSKGVLVLKAGIKVKRQLMDIDQDAAGGWGDITSIDGGFDVRITRKGKGINTDYFVKGVPNRTNLIEALKKNKLSVDIAPHDLDKLTGFRSDSEFKQMFEEFSTPTFDNKPATKAVEGPVADEMPASPVESANLVNVTAPPTE